MLAILWLIVWATVAEAFYDDHNWYTSDDGGTFESQKMARDNFTEILRSLVKSHKTPKREGNDELTMSKVKSRLRSLKLFQYTGSSDDFEPSKGQSLPMPEGGNYCTMGRYTKVGCNLCTCVAGQLYICTGTICAQAKQEKRPAQQKCTEGKKRKIDSCNNCYCRHGHEICSTRDCRQYFPRYLRRSLITKYTCHEGVRRTKGCNRCLCRNGEEFCTNNICTHKTNTKKLPQSGTNLKKKTHSSAKPERVHSPPKLEYDHDHYTSSMDGPCRDGKILDVNCKICKCKQNRWRCSKPIFCDSKNQNDREYSAECIEGTSRQIDACNSCYCYAGQEICEQKHCSSEETKSSNDAGPCSHGQILEMNCKLCKCRHNHWRCSRPIFCDSNDKLIKKPSGECREGHTRQIDACNKCYCHFGRELCEQKTCSPEENLRYYRQLRDGIQCVEGSSYKIDSCNYCLCVNGEEMCTRKLCHGSEFLSGTTCTKGSVRQVDPCNYCTCDNGVYVCTDNICGERTRNEDVFAKGECNHWDRKKVGCNTCECLANRWVCTQKNCGGNSVSLDEDDEDEDEDDFAKEECKQWDRKKVDCNTCQCHANRWVCTQKNCRGNRGKKTKPEAAKGLRNNHADAIAEEECNQGDKKKVDCNTCECLSNRWVCTQRNCRGNNGNKTKPEATGELNNDYADAFAEEECNQGDQRKVDCNTCECRNNRWVCTQKMCRGNSGNKTKPEATGELNNNYADAFAEEECNQGDKKKVDCNTCECLNNRWVCTQKICRGNRTKPEATTELNNNYADAFAEEECNQEDKKKVDCNTCECLNNRWVCTQKMCRGNSANKTKPEETTELNNDYADAFAEEECNEGDKKKVDCNTCECLNNRWVCTQKMCRGDSGNKTKPKATGELNNNYAFTEEECNQGDKKKVDCNTCECLNNRWVCTQNICRGNSGNKTNPEATRGLRNNWSLRHSDGECKVGAILNQPDDCNYCRCTYRKKWKCTENACPNYADLYLLRQKMEPCINGSQRRVNSCNYCICHNGVEFCTQKPCENTKMSMVFSEPECLMGEPVPAADSCNLCICFNSDILCTNNSCLRKLTSIEQQKCLRRLKDRGSDGCNFCHCRAGEELCTNRACLSASTNSKDVLKGLCIEGSVRLSGDGCNICVCKEGRLSCTTRKCSRTGLRTSLALYRSLRRSKCQDGFKYTMEDGCNLCVCKGGFEFCTNRACLSDQNIEDDCTEGDVTSHDGCNICVCRDGKYLCTNRNCSQRKKISNAESLMSYIRRRNVDVKKQRKVQSSTRKCSPGKIYTPKDFDPNCPNECICDRGELLCTKRKCFDNWDQQTPFSWPLGRVELSHRQSRHIQFGRPKSCEDYEPLPSDDFCNACMCLNEQKVCTIVTCQDAEFEDTHDELTKKIIGMNGIQGKRKKRVFCEPLSFFSPENNRFCRNCFCLDNGLALCLLNLCKYSRDLPHYNNSPEELDEICNPGEIGYPTKCVRCTCSETSKWICTREDVALCQERDCDVKDEFRMGFSSYCASCKCPVKEWFCSIQSEACMDYSDVTCPAGTFIFNPNQRCSICICGDKEEGTHNMCFTEAKCVRQVSSYLRS